MKRSLFPFENLEVWQASRELVVDICKKTREFPRSELYGITGQLNRASISVANNLAEGSTRASLKDQAHFSNQAYGSLMETASDVIISADLGFIKREPADALLGQVHDLAVRIHNLRQSQLRRSQS